MDNKIYLVEELWMDSLENGCNASGYSPIGFVFEHEKSNPKLLKQFKGDGYPIAKGRKIPVYKLTELNHLKFDGQ